jgi:hypothetical protein
MFWDGKEKPMRSGVLNHERQSEVTILARILGNQAGKLPRNMARYILNCVFDERDKARMHDLAIRNQRGHLSADEKEELLAFAKAGTILSILKSRARQVLGIKIRKRIPR